MNISLLAACVTVTLGFQSGGSAALDTSVPGYLNPIRAGVDQVATGVFQFWIEVAEPPPVDPDPAHWYTYIWFLDTDCSPVTGQPHGPLGSEYNLRAMLSNRSSCGVGFIDVLLESRGYVVPIFVDGPKVVIRVTLDEIGHPAQFNWNCGAFCWDGTQAYLETPQTCIPGSTTLPDTQPERVIIEPFAHLDTVATSTLAVRAYNSRKMPLSLENRSVKSFASQDSAQIVGQRIRAIPGKAGLLQVTAMVDGVLSANIASVMVGEIEVSPAIMHLEPSTHPTGTVSLAWIPTEGV